MSSLREQLLVTSHNISGYTLQWMDGASLPARLMPRDLLLALVRMQSALTAHGSLDLTISGMRNCIQPIMRLN